MFSIQERMESLMLEELASDEAVSELADLLDPVLAENGYTVEASSALEYVGAIQDGIHGEDKQLSEIIGTVLAGVAAYHGAKKLAGYLTKPGSARKPEWHNRSLANKAMHRVFNTGTWKKEKDSREREDLWRKADRARAQAYLARAKYDRDSARNARKGLSASPETKAPEAKAPETKAPEAKPSAPEAKPAKTSSKVKAMGKMKAMAAQKRADLQKAAVRPDPTRKPEINRKAAVSKPPVAQKPAPAAQNPAPVSKPATASKPASAAKPSSTVSNQKPLGHGSLHSTMPPVRPKPNPALAHKPWAAPKSAVSSEKTVVMKSKAAVQKKPVQKKPVRKKKIIANQPVAAA